MASSQLFPQKSRAAAVLDKPRFTGGLSKTLVKRILRFLGCKTFLNDLLAKHCKGIHPPTPFDTGKTYRVVGERTFGIPVLADSYSQKRMNEKNYLRNARLAKHVQGFKLHHWKLTWHWKIIILNGKYSFIHAGFSIAMLVLGRIVFPSANLEWKIGPGSSPICWCKPPAWKTDAFSATQI